MREFLQDEVEALVRLLLAGRCQDGILTLSEGDEFNRLIAALPWKSKTDLNFFVVTEAARIRNTLATHREDFIKTQCSRLHSTAARESAVHMLKNMLEIDGRDPKEDAFLSSVLQRLGM